jgi:hypothetical protein
LSDATAILLQLVLGNWANLQLQVLHATENQLHKTVAKWQISSSVMFKTFGKHIHEFLGGFIGIQLLIKGHPR